MKKSSKDKISTNLILNRFCGHETYPIRKATWNLDREEGGMMNLCLCVEAGSGTLLHKDTKELDAEPMWEVNFIKRGLTRSDLVPGARFSVPNGYDGTLDENVTNFYYCEHEGSDKNVIEVLKVDGDRFLVRLTGETTDVNYYDGSKPSTKLCVETWFVYDPETMRSIE